MVRSSRAAAVNKHFSRPVSAQVDAYAQVCAPDDTEVFSIMEWLYKNLAANCEQKAKFAASIAKEAPSFHSSRIAMIFPGEKPKPFSFRLRGAQIATSRTTNRDGTRPRRHKLGRKRPVISRGDQRKRMRPRWVGNTTAHHQVVDQRIFGSRKLATLVGASNSSS
jgi:hypothetical protein